MNKRLLITAISVALCAPLTAQAFEAELSGQVNRMIMLPDDASGDETQFVDNGISGSRFRFKGKHKLNNGLTIGVRQEYQFQDGNSKDRNGGDVGDTADKLDVRWNDLFFSGNFGKVSLGKGNGAANGNTEADLSGTAVIAGAQHMDAFGGLTITIGGTTINSVYSTFDAFSRSSRLRYDSLTFNGFGLSASLTQGGANEIGLRYKGKFSGHKLLARAFVADASDNTSYTDTTGASISWLASFGLSLTASYSKRDNTSAQDPENTWFKIGYKVGKHAFAVDAGTTENLTANTEADTIGITYVYKPAKGVEIYASSRDFDVTGVSASMDPSVIAIGSRIKF